MINYANEEVKFSGCPGCAYARYEFKLPCGLAFENNNFTLSQDWELPIVGFFVISPKKHISKLSELTKEERNEMFDIIDDTIKILRKNNVCEDFNVIFEEKENRHFHVWIMPRHKWMKEICGNIMNNIGEIFDYAKQNYRNEETYNKIEESTNILKLQLKK
ncbi:MAG: hypothetical protein IJD92_05270 [Bacilli bacterium]|nr:hypothetical protein [Bacilli bacterium]